MATTSLTQAEADALLSAEKRQADADTRDYPGLGGKLTVPLVSADGQEYFFLDLRRGRLDLRKGNYQTRGRRVVILARLDFGGAPHRNPDGQEVGSTHLHIYREGFGDKWAIPVPTAQFPSIQDPWLTLEDFMCYCNIVEPPLIRRGLFT